MRKYVLLLMLAAALPACGLKGPLYLPQQKPAAAPPPQVPATPSPSVPLDDMRNRDQPAKPPDAPG